MRAHLADSSPIVLSDENGALVVNSPQAGWADYNAAHSVAACKWIRENPLIWKDWMPKAIREALVVGVPLPPPASGATAKVGDVYTTSIKLSTEPSNEVTVEVTSKDAKCIVQTATLSFDRKNFGNEQQVRVATKVGGDETPMGALAYSCELQFTIGRGHQVYSFYPQTGTTATTTVLITSAGCRPGRWGCAASVCGSASGPCTDCPAGTSSAGQAMLSNACLPCAAGKFCPKASSAPSVCPAGHYCPQPALALECTTSGAYCPLARQQARGGASVALLPQSARWIAVTLLRRRASTPSQSVDSARPGTLSWVAALYADRQRVSLSAFVHSRDIAARPQDVATKEGLCRAGYFCPTPTKEVECEVGSYCPEASTAANGCPSGWSCAMPASFWTRDPELCVEPFVSRRFRVNQFGDVTMA